MGLGPNLTQKLTRELKFFLTLIMVHLLNTQAMWDFQHASSRVTGGHPSQHVQQMEDSGPQPIRSGSDTMLEMGLGPNSTQKLTRELRFFLTLINGQSS
jgi:hypothetical protein